MAKHVRIHSTALFTTTQGVWQYFVTYLLNICVLPFALHQKTLPNAMQQDI